MLDQVQFVGSIFMTRPRGYKTFFHAQHEILSAQEIQHFSGSDTPRMLFFPLINVKMPTIVGILTFMSRKNFMPS